jgi:hypothetical protein
MSTDLETGYSPHMDIRAFLNGLLCWIGLHDYEVIEATFGFGDSGSVEKDQCRRCGKVRTRQVPPR